MRGKSSNLFYGIISFLLGVLVCYFFAQIRFLEIDKEVNVVETVVAMISIVIGIFIAVFIQKRNNQNQNLYNYLTGRLDQIWSEFNSFFSQIEQTDSVELSKVTSFVKRFQMKNVAIVKLLKPISVANDLESLSDEFESIFANGLIRNNIVYYDGTKEQIINSGIRIQEEFIKIYIDINSKS